MAGTAQITQLQPAQTAQQETLAVDATSVLVTVLDHISSISARGTAESPQMTGCNCVLFSTWCEAIIYTVHLKMRLLRLLSVTSS